LRPGPAASRVQGKLSRITLRHKTLLIRFAIFFKEIIIKSPLEIEVDWLGA
jgi:hypothetical protein